MVVADVYCQDEANVGREHVLISQGSASLARFVQPASSCSFIMVRGRVRILQPTAEIIGWRAAGEADLSEPSGYSGDGPGCLVTHTPEWRRGHSKGLVGLRVGVARF
jgi:hypothetical protein